MTDDPDARKALWRALISASDQLAGRCDVFTTRAPGSAGRLRGSVPPASVENWRLVEGLSLLAILLKADSIISPRVTNLFGKTGPVFVVEDGKERAIWTQPKLPGHASALVGVPDILVTGASDSPSASNALRVVECKSGKRVGAPLIRGEFGKAYDLRVTSYFIWSFRTPSPRAIEGAKSLGLDLVPLGLDGDLRDALTRQPENLMWHVANTLAAAKTEQRFARALLQAGEDISGKITLL